jgi:hypothetical protein
MRVRAVRPFHVLRQMTLAASHAGDQRLTFH